MLMRRYVFWILFVGLLIFTRFYNLDYTARFTEDESKDLVGIHQLFVDKKFTLVGPTNEQGTKVFSSLTFYMLLPGAVIGKFDLASPAYMSAFWGVLTAILIVYMTKKANPKLVPLVALLTIVWFPLLETSRWAWNPNLIPFWIALALICYQMEKKYFLFLTGLFFGLSVHSHYYAIFASVTFMFLVSINFFIKKKLHEIILMWLGFFISLFPFIIFDLRHPPGIFLPNLLSQSKSVGGGINMIAIFVKTLQNMWSLMLSYTQSIYFAILLVVINFALITRDFLKKNFALVFIIPWIAQCFVIAAIPQFFPHYLIPALIFFIFWLIYKRKGFGRFLSYAALMVLIFGGIFSIYHQLTTSTSVPSMPVVREITRVIKDEISMNNLKNVNIAVLASPDQNTSGKKYRDLLLVDGNIHILTKDEYSLSDHLFVISMSDEKTVRLDPAAEMYRFRSGPLVSATKIDDSGWFVYHFTRGF